MLGENRPGSLDLVLEPARFADDAETDLGWVVTSAASSGDWERVDPNGTEVQTVSYELTNSANLHVPVGDLTGQSIPQGREAAISVAFSL